MTLARARQILVPTVMAVVLVPIAWWAYQAGTTDFRYQIAGLADPFLGRPAPFVTIGIGIVLSLAVAGGMAVVHRVWRSDEPAESRLRWHWWLVPLAGWAGYFVAAAMVMAGGGPVVYPGTLRLDFGTMGSTVQADVTCRSVVNAPGTIAELRSTDLAVTLRNLAIGGESWYPSVNWDYRPSPGELIPAWARERPAIQRQMLDGDGGVVAQDQILFFRAYSVRVLAHSDSGLSGRLDLYLAREAFADNRWVRYLNVFLADDPWPPNLNVRATWTCGPRSRATAAG